MRKAITIISITAVLVAGLSAALWAKPETVDKGADMMQLDSGRLPAVPFPHHLHQDRLNDCSVCHAMFPQTRGAIKELQDQGKIKKQEIMNKNCIACHKERKMAGKPSGPLSCMDCHPR